MMKATKELQPSSTAVDMASTKAPATKALSMMALLMDKQATKLRVMKLPVTKIMRRQAMVPTAERTTNFRSCRKMQESP